MIQKFCDVAGNEGNRDLAIQYPYLFEGSMTKTHFLAPTAFMVLQLITKLVFP